MTDIYLQKIKEIAKRMDNLDTELVEYRNKQVKLENEVFRLLEELRDELLKKESVGGLRLVREEIYNYNVYQFFVDDNGKRYIKHISCDDESGVIVLTFNEDDTISSVKDKLPKEEFGMLAKTILEMFGDESIWKGERKDE